MNIINNFYDLTSRGIAGAYFAIAKRQCFVISIVVTIIFYLPSLKNNSIDAGFLYTGDVLGWYLPALAKTHSLIHSLNFTAIDYSTFNGSSDFFLSPNFFAYHPIVVIYCLLVSPQTTSIQQLGQFFVLLMAAHSFLALYFSIKLFKRFFGFDLGSAVLTAVAFAFSIHMLKSLGQPPFFLSATITAWAAYASLEFVEKRSAKNLVTAILPILFGLLGGYMPLGVACLALSAILVAVRLLYVADVSVPIVDRIRSLLIGMLPYCISVIIVAPYVYSLYSFHKETLSAGVGSLFYSAYEYSQLPQRLLTVFSTHINVPGGREYELSIFWGFILIPLTVIFFCSYKTESELLKNEWKLFKAASLIYFATVLASFGVFSVVSDLVYYLIPQVGRMHVYQRFFIPAELMLGVIFALMLKSVINQRPLLAMKLVLTIMVFLTFFVAFLLSYKTVLATELGIDNYLVIELLIGSLFVFTLFFPSKKFIYSATVILFCLPLLDKIYDYSAPGADFEKQSKRIFILDEGIKKKILLFFKNNSDKSLIKYVDITPMWVKGTASKFYADGGVESFPKVFPDFALEQNLSSYGGFTFYLSARADYMKKMPVVGEEIAVSPDWEYIKNSGADFLVARESDIRNGPLAYEFSEIKNENILRLPNEVIIVPLNIGSKKQDNLEKKGFDNGYLRVLPVHIEKNRNLINISSGRPAKQSSDAGAAARLAVDGNTNGNFSLGSVSHTLRDVNAWLEIDLEASEPIDNVTIWNRTDCCGYCLRNFWLFISDEPFKASDTASELSKRPGTWGRQNFAPNPKGTFPVNGVRGRYVRVQLPGGEDTLKECFLSIAELEVYRSSESQRIPVVAEPLAVSNTIVHKFSTNHANYMALDFEAPLPSTVQYLLWDNPRLKYYLNGIRITPVQKDGVTSIDTSAGRNLLEIQYRHWHLTVFCIFYALYAIIFMYIMIFYRFKVAYGNKLQNYFLKTR